MISRAYMKDTVVTDNMICTGSQLLSTFLTGADRSSTDSWVSVRAIAAKCSGGVLMYCRKAALCHLPSVLIMESSIPFFAAVVAAPIRKLWPAYWSWGRPSPLRIARIWVVNHGLVMVFPFLSRNNGPGAERRLAKYWVSAITGHTFLRVQPKKMWAPLPHWSHFNLFRCILIMVGSVLLSAAASPQQRFSFGSKAFSVVGSNSPRRKNPMNNLNCDYRISSNRFRPRLVFALV